jgi:hypothetical protein
VIWYGAVVAALSLNRIFVLATLFVVPACSSHSVKPASIEPTAKATPIPSAPVQQAPTTIATTNRAVSAPHEALPSLTAISLEERLDKRSVTDRRFARRDLYSWTTPDQASALRKTKTLLVATAKTRGAPSPYSRLLSRLSDGQGPTADVAKLFVEHPGLTKRRYAWPSPFATAVPLGERSYGHVLVHIVLKDDAFLAKLDPLEPEPFSFIDMNNQPVALADALQHPEKIAAVFHVRLKPEGGPKFREYIVCNESMIARWSLGTAHERTIVTQDAALIADLLASPLLSAATNEAQLDAASAWAVPIDKPTLLDAWRAAIAFDSPKYKPSRSTLEAIAKSLAAYDPAGDAVDHVPTDAFPAKP